MAIIKDFGVVLRQYDAGESNKKLVLLTRGHGKITVFARGAKRTGSKLAIELFSYNEFVIFDGGDFYSLNSVVPIHIFENIGQDYDKFCVACCFLELADKMVLASMDTNEILNILLYSIQELLRGRHTPKLVFAVFAIRLLKEEGFAPLVADKYVQTGENTLWLSDEIAKALVYIMKANLKNLFAFKTSNDVSHGLYIAARAFLYENVESEIKSLDMMIGD
ncbi:MAG: DNA repair protein RecO [Defluviitaleaceae bacterium]|nr:DNA repair protein RecO [Defluviitaleaceae bacterium]